MTWILTSLLLLPAAAPTPEMAEARLRAEISVTEDYVRLEDVAEIHCDNADRARRLGSVEVAVAPPPGQPINLHLAQIKQALARRHFRVASIRFSGHQSVTVARLEPTTTATEESSSGAQAWEETITAMIEGHVEEFSGWPKEQLDVQVDTGRADDHLATHRPERWEILVPDQWRLGTQSLTLEIAQEPRPLRFVVVVTIERRRQVVVAKRRILRGTRLRESDVESRWLRVARDDNVLLTDIKQTIDTEARRVIEAGQPLRQTDLRRRPLVFRGSPVSVTIQQGGVALQMIGIAKEDGALGEWIEVENPTTRQLLDSKVRVIGFQKALWPDPRALLQATPDAYSSSTNGR
ncbi:flagellar basal body P-ring biosynthesis protein FlgA [Planctomycetes bacterium Pan216]|uniref:Flagellar basal body P-ring biosynthesis protein FlgA n=1 Tax=Kolteria novifilia TaxID=2527975 RepID=A0A518AXS9_9BACT|nr:flagellar basal body P-ring biosynthesis protein FlgA [Planctomycetes bacterium Pan216]